VERGAGTTSDEEEISGRCRVAISDALGIEAIVEVLERETLPRAGYKASRVVDP
jgi:phenylacetate-coenzyme A ligase PaaK-like adenylate-forming protein